MYIHSISLILQHLRGAMTLVPGDKKMSLLVGSRTVNMYAELAGIIKFNASRLEEAIVLFSSAISVEVTPVMQARWLVKG